jgi:hypothetical protein
LVDGLYNTTVVALRDLVRSITWTDSNDDPVDLTLYTRLIYNIQTDTAVPAEVLTVDSDAHPTWLFIEAPATGGVIKLEVPGANVPYIHSDTGRWIHELILLDGNGGIITCFHGKVVLRKNAVEVP